MPLGPTGFAPPIPGVTNGNGMSPDNLSNMAMLSMMMGMKPEKEDTAGQMIEQVIQLLRKAGNTDPRLAPLTMDLLQRLTEGPSSGSGAPGGAAGMGASPVPAGGPTSAMP